MKAWLLRVLYFGLPLLVVVASIVALNAGPVLKRPTSSADDFAARMQMVSGLVSAGRWDEAATAADELGRAWQQVQRRVKYVAGEAELRQMALSVAELQGAVEGRQAGEFRVAHRKLQALWDDLAR